ncbi:DUF488 domain-containing protein [Actinomyces radicidentis]|uniref:DUF488 domain-containing protein n=1 Tax=Actinomyces radicidentis TaxID=111015 RepID=UPI0026DFF3E1|nr:DUF488 family protein [Actinomyces radicidentis]
MSTDLPTADSIALAYVRDGAGDDDGYRVLIDRLWPRGVSKAKAAVDEWCKAVAPSDGLRKAFHHDGLPWEDFEERYRAELKEGERHEAMLALRERARSGRVTLVYGTKGGDERSQAPVLRAVMLGR